MNSNSRCHTGVHPQKAFIGRLNGTLRDEVLDLNCFRTLDEARIENAVQGTLAASTVSISTGIG